MNTDIFFIISGVIIYFMLFDTRLQRKRDVKAKDEIHQKIFELNKYTGEEFDVASKNFELLTNKVKSLQIELKNQQDIFNNKTNRLEKEISRLKREMKNELEKR